MATTCGSDGGNEKLHEEKKNDDEEESEEAVSSAPRIAWQSCPTHNVLCSLKHHSLHHGEISPKSQFVCKASGDCPFRTESLYIDSPALHAFRCETHKLPVRYYRPPKDPSSSKDFLYKCPQVSSHDWCGMRTIVPVVNAIPKKEKVSQRPHEHSPSASTKNNGGLQPIDPPPSCEDVKEDDLADLLDSKLSIAPSEEVPKQPPRQPVSKKIETITLAAKSSPPKAEPAPVVAEKKDEGVPDVAPELLTKSLAALAKERDQLQSTLDKLAAKLPDGGAKIRAHIHDLTKAISYRERVPLEPHPSPNPTSPPTPHSHLLQGTVKENQPPSLVTMRPVCTSSDQLLGSLRLLSSSSVSSVFKDDLKRLIALPFPNLESPLGDPALLTSKLMRHQKEALTWMVWREQVDQPLRGGFLADDMGLGKTLTVISLVMHSIESQQPRLPKPSSERSPPKAESTQSLPHHHPLPHRTLIVCPASLLHQWPLEVTKHVSPDKIPVLVYHGSHRESIFENLPSQCIVVTTYQTLSSDFKRKASQLSHASSSPSYPQASACDRPISSGPKVQTLTSPSSKVDGRLGDDDENEEEDLEELVDEQDLSSDEENAKVSESPGADKWRYRHSNAAGTSPSPRKKGVNQPKPSKSALDVSSLLDVSWNRVVLDEGHMVKNHKTANNQAVCALTADCRWILSGTPIQNSTDEMFGLFKFLRFGAISNIRLWNKEMKKQGGVDKEKVKALFSYVLMRRTKADRDDKGNLLIPLPKRHFVQHEVRLSKHEQSIYDELARELKACLAKASAEHKSNVAVFLVHLLRARLCCDHPWLLTGGVRSFLEEESLFAQSLPMGDEIFTADDSDDLTSALSRLSLDQEESSSPRATDRKTVDSESSLPSLTTLLGKVSIDYQSSKLSLIVSEVKRLLLEDPSAKFVIISQWTRMLDVIAHHLALVNGFKLDRIDGTCSPSDRARAMQAFNEDPEVPILLLSLKAGGVGLNLTGGNHVILVDMHYNPAWEDQAFDRVYRVGQKREVYVHTFKTKHTAEEQIAYLQRQKRLLAQDVLSGKKSKTQFNTTKELMALFT